MRNYGLMSTLLSDFLRLVALCMAVASADNNRTQKSNKTNNVSRRTSVPNMYVFFMGNQRFHQESVLNL